MPAAFRLSLGPGSRGNRAPSPKQIHGFLCHTFGESDDDHLAQTKPWATWPASLQERRRMLLRFSWLCDDKDAGLDSRLGRSLRFGPVQHSVHDVQEQREAYEELMDGAATSIQFRFVSPTWFSRNGRLYPIPDPVLVFSRLADRWATFSTVTLDPDSVAALVSTVSIADLAGATHQYPIGKADKVGFVGTARYSIAARSSPDTARTMAALSRFAQYCGVGASTTFGAGAVEVSQA